jgi:ribosomal protein S18 acetylase RimI-like enzyme
MGSIAVVEHPKGSSLSDVRVRDARTDELDELARLLADVYGAFRAHLPAEAWELYIGEIVDVGGRLGESDLIVAEDAGRLVGTIGFYPDASHSAIERWPPAWASIRTLGVLAEARRRGVGTALARECMRRAQARGARAIGLHTAAHMATATRLYARLGFRRAPEFGHRNRRDVRRPVAAARRKLAGAGVPARPGGGRT